MKIIAEGAEHHFLTFLEKLKVNPTGWMGCIIPFSKRLRHEDLASRRAFIRSDLSRYAAESQAFAQTLRDRAGALPGAQCYRFADNDVILLCCAGSKGEQDRAREVFEEIARQFPHNFCEYGFLTKEMYLYQKLADQKLLSHKRMRAYDALADESIVESIGLRRRKRDEPLILIVEDDRFTASYLAGFLKEFDLVIARTGEEAILKYVEYAPDATFLDIHLPGLDGHETLQAIKNADPDAFVVMLSVDTARSSILAASQNGAVSYLKKPFSRERVLNTLRLSPSIRESRGILPVQRETAH